MAYSDRAQAFRDELESGNFEGLDPDKIQMPRNAQEEMEFSEEDYLKLGDVAQWAKDNPEEFYRMVGVEDEAGLLDKAYEWSDTGEYPTDILSEVAGAAGVELSPEAINNMIKGKGFEDTMSGFFSPSQVAAAEEKKKAARGASSVNGGGALEQPAQDGDVYEYDDPNPWGAGKEYDPANPMIEVGRNPASLMQTYAKFAGRELQDEYNEPAIQSQMDYDKMREPMPESFDPSMAEEEIMGVSREGTVPSNTLRNIFGFGRGRY